MSGWLMAYGSVPVWLYVLVVAVTGAVNRKLGFERGKAASKLPYTAPFCCEKCGTSGTFAASVPVLALDAVNVWTAKHRCGDSAIEGIL